MSQELMISLTCCLVAILLVIAVLTGDRFQLSMRDRETRYIVVMLMTTVLACVIDVAVYCVIGLPAPGFRAAVFVGKSLLFAAHSVVTVAWVLLLESHLQLHKGRLWHAAILVVPILAIALLVVNAFAPVVFWLDDANAYHRGPLAQFYFVFLIAYVLYGLVLRFEVRRKTALVRFFPVWSFVLPIVVGAFFQLLVYGLSLTWPSVAIAVTGILISLNNDKLYVDKLTGAYNRAYFDMLDQMTEGRRTRRVGVMLDVNGFKDINDTFGHEEGDRALVALTDVLRQAVRNVGVVIRYAGDEFVILSNDDSVDEKNIEHRVAQALDRYNATSGKPYALSVAMGGCALDASTMSMATFTSRLDELMYQDKQAYYQRMGIPRGEKNDTSAPSTSSISDAGATFGPGPVRCRLIMPDGKLITADCLVRPATDAQQGDYLEIRLAEPADADERLYENKEKRALLG